MIAVTSALALVRVLVAFCFIFLLLPFLARRRSLHYVRSGLNGGTGTGVLALQFFVRASLVAEVGCLLLGKVGLCLPGVLLAGCILFVLRGALPQARIESEESDPGFWSFLFIFLEDQRAGKAQVRARLRQCFSTFRLFKSIVVGASIAVLVFVSARSALTQLRFDRPETYVKAVSLGALTGGQLWQPDASIALLAPLIPFSGLDAASVIRFAGPIFTAVFMLVLTLCVPGIWKNSVSILGSLGLCVTFLLVVPSTASEFTPALVSGVYWIAAPVLWSVSRRDSLLTVMVAVMSFPGWWALAGLSLLLLLALDLRTRWAHDWKKHLAAALVTGVCITAAGAFARSNAKPVLMSQYESAARVCERINRQFPRKEWIVVSPFQELAFTYGRGWHVELSDFVSRVTLDEVAHAKYSLPYDCPNVFFFVERRPIIPGALPGVRNAVWRYSPAESTEWSSFLYTDPVGRNSLEYRSAELLNAYARSHRNLSVFYEDNDLFVYHLVRSETGS
jgi:hypothetical protein